VFQNSNWETVHVPGDAQLITGITGDALMCGDISLSHLTLLITLTISHINKFPPRVSNSINAPARSIQQPVLRGHTPTGHSRSCARVIKSLTTPSWSGSAARCHSSSRAGLARCSPDLHDAPSSSYHQIEARGNLSGRTGSGSGRSISFFTQ
jgi:hypothetical protein